MAERLRRNKHPCGLAVSNRPVNLGLKKRNNCNSSRRIFLEEEPIMRLCTGRRSRLRESVSRIPRWLGLLYGKWGLGGPGLICQKHGRLNFVACLQRSAAAVRDGRPEPDQEATEASVKVWKSQEVWSSQEKVCVVVVQWRAAEPAIAQTKWGTPRAQGLRFGSQCAGSWTFAGRFEAHFQDRNLTRNFTIL